MALQLRSSRIQHGNRTVWTRIIWISRVVWLRFSRTSFAAVPQLRAGTNAETSPPMPVIWRTKVAVIGRYHRRSGCRKHGLDFRRHGGVHAGHLHLVVKLGGVAHAADEDRGADPLGRRNNQIREGRADDFAARGARDRRASLFNLWPAAHQPRTADVLPGCTPIASTSRSWQGARHRARHRRAGQG